MYDNALKTGSKIFAVAPMMDWTDRHCRFFHRLMTREALLYTEMVVADAIIHGDREHLMGCDATAGPVALQLGGSDPMKLAQAARLAMEYGFAEINLNVGCPSDRVQSGMFGACLMREPQLVGRCVAAMKDAVDVPVTVKCRIGVDEQEVGPALDNLAAEVWKSGADGLWVHARKAWLEGLSPKENRSVPPLDYGRVYRLKAENMNRFIGLNGGIESLNHAMELRDGVDGVMIGRAAYQQPRLLLQVDQQFYDSARDEISMEDLCAALCIYAEGHLSNGGRLNQITRHIIGLFHGEPGARQYRQHLSIAAVKPGAGARVIEEAFAKVRDIPVSSAA